MGLDRKRRRTALKQRFRLLTGGKPPELAPPAEMSPSDRLGAAVHVLVTQFRNQAPPLSRAEEVRVLLDVAAKFSIDLQADAEQFAQGAAFVYEEMEKKLAALPPPEAG